MLDFNDFTRLALMCDNDNLRNDVRRLNDNINNLRNEITASKDRVDISLKEYEELKRINKDLLVRLRHAESILGALGIAADMIPNMVPDSVKWYVAEDINMDFHIRKNRVRIEFDMEEER